MRLPNNLRGAVSGVVLLLGMSLRLSLTPGFLSASLCGAGTAVMAAEPDAPRRTYNLPRGDAASTLRQFATASGRPVFFMMEKVQGEQTNAVAGIFTPAEALQRMLAGTDLAVLQGEGDEEFVVGRRPKAASLREVGHDKPQPKTNPMNPSTSGGKLRTWLAHLALAITTVATAQQKTIEESPTKAQDDVVVLSPFTVSATADVGYGSTMNTSGRLAKPYQDVPQMANVVTSELLQDMKRYDQFGALALVPGFSMVGNTPLFPSYTIRGIFSSSALYVGGFPSLGAGYVYDIGAFADRIEVVKGPSPTSFGRGDPAGFINYVLKDPTFRRSTDVDVMFGTGHGNTVSQRYQIDTNGLLTEDGKTGYRFVAVSSKGSEPQKFTDYETNAFMISLKRNFASRGALSLKALASNDSMPGANMPFYYTDQDFYLNARSYYDIIGATSPAFQVLGRGADYLAYSQSGDNRRMFTAIAELNYKLGEHWSTRQAAQFAQTRQNLNAFLANGAFVYDSDGTTVLNAPFLIFSQSSGRKEAFQSDFVGHYSVPALGAELEVLTGGDYSSNTSRGAFDGRAATPQSLHNWNPNVPVSGWSINPNDVYTRTVTRNSSVYAQTEARFLRERLRLTGSWRRNYTKIDSLNTTNNTETHSKTDSPVLPAYSALFKINDALSVYALYSRYSEPPALVRIFPDLVSSEPDSQLEEVFQSKTELREVGLKGILLEGRVSFSVCAYELTQNGAPTGATVPHSGGVAQNGYVTKYIPSDTALKGFEFEMFGKATNKLTFTLNGTYIASSRTLFVYTPIGQASVVKHLPAFSNPNTLAGYANYSFSGDRRRGLALTIGGKIIFSGWSLGSGGRDYPHTNSVVDLGASYGYNDNCSFYVKANNISERWYTPSSTQGYIAGRKVMAGVDLHF